MATFNELVELARNPGEGFTLDGDFIETLVEAHSVDLEGAAGQAEILSNDILTKDDVIAQLTAEISGLKASNYDLLTRLPADGGDGGGSGGDENDGDDETPDVDDLFEN